MKITHSSSEIHRTDLTREVQRTPPGRERDGSADLAGTASGRGDRVQISNAGRALAAQSSGEATDSLTPERIAEVRERILSGAYNSLDVVDQVARKMLASGDI